MRVDNSTGKGMSGMGKFESKAKFTECTWSLEASFLTLYMKIETQILERLQSVSVVDGVAHNQKDDVENNGGSLENVAEVSCCYFAAFSRF
jgi:hypothetical protein